ncbi:hypothetical protein V5F77_11070 [Xanthobacter sp. DSM 24535]|uniref:hypothetical protein n=1 Tax=Roseixanthobacter psychrophilus TaxID=3119917 RepID=UPI0037283627
MLNKTEKRWFGFQYDHVMKESYEVEMVTHTMDPKVELGEFVWVRDRSAEVETGNLVVVRLLGEGDSILTYVKKFISKTSKELVLEQINPPVGHDAILRFPADRVLTVHRAAQWGERTDPSCRLYMAS